MLCTLYREIWTKLISWSFNTISCTFTHCVVLKNGNFLSHKWVKFDIIKTTPQVTSHSIYGVTILVCNAKTTVKILLLLLCHKPTSNGYCKSSCCYVWLSLQWKFSIFAYFTQLHINSCKITQLLCNKMLPDHLATKVQISISLQETVRKLWDFKVLEVIWTWRVFVEPITLLDPCMGWLCC